MNEEAILELQKVSHAFGPLLALDDVSLTIAPGELVCLVGPSGCGKTTLLRVAAGLEELQQGGIAIDGRTVAGRGAHMPPEERGVGLVFQDYALFPHLSVLDNVGFGLRRQPAAQRRMRSLEILEQLGVAGLARNFPHTLSGGQQQRVALARALAPKPRLMLLDEPADRSPIGVTGSRQCLISPGLPIHGIVGMLQQVWARLAGQPVGMSVGVGRRSHLGEW